MSEACARCGSVGEDRRTLWMACLYAMDEMSVSFEKVGLWVVKESAVTTSTVAEPYKATSYPPGGPPVVTEGEWQRLVHRAEGAARRQLFFTLRVCKRCRGEWMAAVRDWFHAAPEGRDHDADERTEGQPPSGPGTGIFVRDLGVIREVTTEEWEQRAADAAGRKSDER